jgi:hypothetical protein
MAVRPLRVLLVLWSLLLTVAFSPLVSQRAEATSEALVALPAIVPQQLLVGFLPGTAEAERDVVVAARGGITVTRFDALDARLIAVAGARPLGEVARAFFASGVVRYAEPNAVARGASTPSDPRIGEQWALRTVGALDSAGNWAVPPGDRSVVVGIVDSGISADHPDLAANLWSAPAGWTLGCPAGSHGYSVIGGETSCVPNDQFGTGTALAGVIGAVGDNAIGISGINQRVGIMALKCVDAQGVVRIADAVAVIEHAIAVKAAGVDLRILVIGWTTTAFSQSFQDVIAAAGAAGILVVVAAGDSDDNLDTQPHYPASFAAPPHNLPNVLGVLATDSSDSRPVAMNYGANTVHLAAPGSGVLTTAVGAQEYAGRTTSALAADHVAGAPALTIAATPGQTLSVADLRSRLLACGDPILELASTTKTGRRLNVAQTVANAADCAYRLNTAVQADHARGSIQVDPNAPT